MTVLDGRQRRIIKEVNKNKDFQHALNVWELQKYVRRSSTAAVMQHVHSPNCCQTCHGAFQIPERARG